MSVAASQVSPLRWLKPDAYHIRTECGRFTVARVTVQGIDWYNAYRRIETPDGTHCVELGRVSVGPRATDAERLQAIRDMQALCEAAA